MTTGLENTLAALWRQHRPEVANAVPIAIEREPERKLPGTENADQDQTVIAAVPAVPTVPSVSEHQQRLTHAERREAEAMEWQERAAVLEFSGGLSREDAEQQAALELNYHRPVEPPAGSFRRWRF